ncbi:SDR family oxidoreductase [Robbsia andropogonis]|uniref:SDR family oxidoreductase n=1 Tax=Robbsia andropogonis TaxID=28092 RepID=UPI00209D2DFC|nr:SDR family oxidoreductase [Robbsia andropogonis]MCP1121464.1 SDR family oxidoreductase [Robbsia andropogonis]MCP1131077.1 SDR family oxidoreductase [Robbsia andropogonis]
MVLKLEGKVAFITGAARGLGRATALTFSREGADVVLLDVAANIGHVPYNLSNESQLLATAQRCEELGAAVEVVKADVRKQTEVAAAVQRALRRFGQVDILVNNAGIAGPSGKAVHDVSEDEWQVMLDVNLTGAWRTIKEIGPGMVERKSGSIINISSTAGVIAYRHFAGYVAAKHGLIGLTKAAALDYAPHRVRVNAICPGSIRDDQDYEGTMLSGIARALDVDQNEYESVFTQSQPNNELLNPDDVAAAALWLATDDATRMIGGVITLDGGFSIK